MAITRMIENAKNSASGETPGDDMDLRARKRMEVGLAPNRPTAKAAPLRPPNYQTLPLPPAMLALILVGIVLVTAVLVTTNLSGRLPSWWPSWSGLAVTGNSSASSSANLPNQAFSLRLADDFSQSNSPLIQGSRPNEWRIELLPSESVYVMEVSPNHLAWSLLGVSDLGGYRLQTSVLVDDETLGGYAGLIVRYLDERHFYLLSVDGNGRFQIQQQDGDELIVIQPWTMAPFLNRAGSANLLTIEDDGNRVLFFGNNMLIAEISDPAYSLGFVGLAGGAQGQTDAEIRFDWFQLYDRASTSE